MDLACKEEMKQRQGAKEERGLNISRIPETCTRPEGVVIIMYMGILKLINQVD